MSLWSCWGGGGGVGRRVVGEAAGWRRGGGGGGGGSLAKVSSQLELRKTISALNLHKLPEVLPTTMAPPSSMVSVFADVGCME